MCYQAFVHYACGHEEIIDTVCKQGEGITFWVKHACAGYKFESKFPNSQCGKGRYYCGKLEVDGPFLDGVHTALETCQAEVAAVEQKVAMLRQTAQQFTIIANAKNVPQNIRKMHPTYVRIINAHGSLMEQRAASEMGRVKATHVIKEAMKFFRNRAQNAAQQGDFCFKAAFVLPLEMGRLPMELENPHPQHLAAPSTLTAATDVRATQQMIDVGQSSELTCQVTNLPPSEGQEIDATRVRLAKVHAGDGKTATSAPLATQTPRKRPPPPGGLEAHRIRAEKRAKEYLAKHGNSSALKTVPLKASPLASAEDGGKVRRSTRTRGKKVSYAESQASDASQGTSNSPDKYEASLGKSIRDSSGSPEPTPKSDVKQPRKPQRGPDGRRINGSKCGPGETLASKIDDWKRRAGSAAGDTSGKSTVQEGTSSEGGQAARKQRGQQTATSRRASKNVWHGPPLANPPALMNGGPFTMTSTNMLGFDNGNGSGIGDSGPSTQYTRSTYSAFSPPFPSNTNTSAVGTPNLFNSYLQQSYPGVISGPASSQSWSVQPGANQPMQHAAPIQQSQANNMMYGTGQAQTNYQNFGSPSDVTTPLNNLTVQPFQLQDNLMDNTAAARMQQSGYSGLGNYNYNGGYTGGYDHGMGSGLQTPAQSSRADSVAQGVDVNPLPDIDVSTYFDYDSMRRSFSQPHDLSPAKTPDIVVTDTEPKKRVLPASSPTPAAKRMRLSLPGHEEDASVYQRDLPYGVETAKMTATSSPAKMSTQDSDFGYYSVSFEGSIHDKSQGLAPPPAPIMAPTSIHFPHAENPTLAKNLEDAAELPGITEDEYTETMLRAMMGEADGVDGGVGNAQGENMASGIAYDVTDDWLEFHE